MPLSKFKRIVRAAIGLRLQLHPVSAAGNDPNRIGLFRELPDGVAVRLKRLDGFSGSGLKLVI